MPNELEPAQSPTKTIADRAAPASKPRPLTVWLITVGEPLPFGSTDTRLWRTGLLAKELVAGGHRVIWWTSTLNHFTKELFRSASDRVDLDNGLSLQFLHGAPYRRNISFARWRNHIEIAREFERLAPKYERPDVVLCSLPTIELSDCAVSFGARAGVPVLVDIRDLWPDEMVARVPRILRWLSPVLFGWMTHRVRRALRNADGIIAISPAYLEWGLQHAGRPQGTLDGVHPHGYPDSRDTSRPEGDHTGSKLLALGVDPQRKIFWFVGTFVHSIDLATVIEAGRLLKNRKDVQFVLTGAGERGLEWQELAAGLENVVFTGWADVGTLNWLARHAYAGIAAYKAGALMSLTNKLFEYMSYSLPILVSLPGEARQLVEKEGIGQYYAPGSASDLADAIQRMIENPSIRAEMSARSRRLYETAFAAGPVYQRLAKFVVGAAGASMDSASSPATHV